MNSMARGMRGAGIALAVLAVGVLYADDAVWNKTAAAGTYDWTNVVNWLPSTTYPNGAGQVAHVTNDIVGAQTIRLQNTVTVGTLLLGDSAASGNNFGITLSSGTGANSIKLRSAESQGTNTITMSAGVGTPTHTISAPLDLAPHSPLVINMGPSQALTLSGAVATNNSSLTVAGAAATLTLNGNLMGNGSVFKNSTGDLIINSGAKDFTGDWIVNGGSLTILSGSLRNSANATLNGYIYDSGGTVRAGGLLVVGSGSAYANDPAQRLPTNVLSLSGGWLTEKGQPTGTNAVGQYAWTNTVIDTVAELKLNETYSIIQMEYATNTLGTLLGAKAFTRSKGGTLAIRGASMANMTRFVYTNNTDFLTGANGVAGSQTMSIIPWLVAANANASAANPSDWAVYIPGAGIRSLNVGEYTSSISLGAGYNVAAGALSTLASNVTVNSFKQNNVGTSTIGSNRTFTIASGALMFVNGNGKFGTPGTNTAGFLNFGAAEGVIWSFPSATNVIGAVITGSNGLVKAGLGTLALAAANTYTGQTTVSASTLIVGDGAVGGQLGQGDVVVAHGARLLINAVSTNAIWDSAALRLAQTRAFCGKVELAAGVNETVRFLYLGGLGMPSGTYGATGSGLANGRDDFFSGTGVLTVTGNASTRGRGTVISVR